jgi:cytochrome b
MVNKLVLLVFIGLHITAAVFYLIYRRNNLIAACLPAGPKWQARRSCMLRRSGGQ